MGLLERIAARITGSRLPERANETSAISMHDWQQSFRPGSQFTYQGQTYQGYPIGGGSGLAGYGLGNLGYYESNSVVFACEAKRVNVFSEARFQFQQVRQGRPGDLFGTPDLLVLEEPWLGASTRDLLAVAELDVATYGNSYWIVDHDGYLLRLDPCNIKILTEAIEDPVSGNRVGERLLGYVYMTTRDTMTIYSPREIAHYKPIPSRCQFLGQSWLSACLSDIDADTQMTEHKRIQLRNGANLSYVVSVDKSVTPDQLSIFAEKFRAHTEGSQNAGKTLFLGGGADVKTIGQTFGDLALAATQAATETRIAACAGTHPVIVGLTEGMSGSSLNSGNYTAAKRNFVDGTMRPLWGAFAGAFQWIVKVPAGARLWYDDRDIAFLREDVKDQAAIQAQDATTIRTLIDAGFKPDAVIDAVKANDLKRLAGQHSGLFSVQLQKPGAKETPVIPAKGAVP